MSTRHSSGPGSTRLQKFKARITRLVEEECEIYVDAADVETATNTARGEAEEVADTIWVRTNSAPHQYDVVKIIPAEELKR